MTETQGSGCFFHMCSAPKYVPQRFERHVEVCSHVRSGTRAAVKTKMFSLLLITHPDRHVALLSQRHLDVCVDENSNEAPRPDDRCRSNAAPTQMCRESLWTHRAFCWCPRRSSVIASTRSGARGGSMRAATRRDPGAGGGPQVVGGVGVVAGGSLWWSRVILD